MGLQTGHGRGLSVKLRSVKVKVRSGSVYIELKFNSFELDSEVGRLVPPKFNYYLMDIV